VIKTGPESRVQSSLWLPVSRLGKEEGTGVDTNRTVPIALWAGEQVWPTLFTGKDTTLVTLKLFTASVCVASSPEI